MADDNYYYEKDTGRAVIAKEFIIFDTLVWDVNYIDEPPVHHMYKDVDFKRKFTKENPKMKKFKFPFETHVIFSAISLYDSLGQLSVLTEEIKEFDSDDQEFKSIVEGLDNSITEYSNKLYDYIKSRADFE